MRLTLVEGLAPVEAGRRARLRSSRSTCRKHVGAYQFCRHFGRTSVSIGSVRPSGRTSVGNSRTAMGLPMHTCTFGPQGSTRLALVNTYVPLRRLRCDVFSVCDVLCVSALRCGWHVCVILFRPAIATCACNGRIRAPVWTFVSYGTHVRLYICVYVRSHLVQAWLFAQAWHCPATATQVGLSHRRGHVVSV